MLQSVMRDPAGWGGGGRWRARPAAALCLGDILRTLSQGSTAGLSPRDPAVTALITHTLCFLPCPAPCVRSPDSASQVKSLPLNPCSRI